MRMGSMTSSPESKVSSHRSRYAVPSWLTDNDANTNCSARVAGRLRQGGFVWRHANVAVRRSFTSPSSSDDTTLPGSK